ncbi:hypothetical protein ACWPKO_30240 (plasmid) [Coraliomargarita sp. W4R53]
MRTTRLDEDLAELIRLVHWDRITLNEVTAHMGIPSSTRDGGISARSSC